MTPYHKIQSVFLRDPKEKHRYLIQGEYTIPEFEYLKYNDWIFTEKVDGTNIRVMFHEGKVTLGGRTDGALIPAELTNHLIEVFTVQELNNVFPISETRVCLYGEGYGAKIQKGGGNYSSTQRFVLFDVKIDNTFLDRDNVEDIASSLGIDCVPIVGTGTLPDAVELCKKGFNSTWGDFQAEGIVARPRVELQTKLGNRIITKVKCKDFPKEE